MTPDRIAARRGPPKRVNDSLDEWTESARTDTRKLRPMQRTPIISSTLKSVGYEEGVLEVEFADGSVYRYLDVPDHEAKAFIASESKGHHFVAFIRGRYEFLRVPET